MTTNKVVLFSNGIAEVQVHLSAFDELRVPKASLELFQSTLHLPENFTLTRKLARPEPFQRQLVSSSNDEFIITAGEKTFKGLACLEGEFVYLQEGAKTIQIRLSDIQAVENVTKLQSEIYQALQAGDISFCVRFENAIISSSLDENGLFQIDLRLSNNLGLPIDGEIVLANREYEDGATFVSDFVSCGPITSLDLKNTQDGLRGLGEAISAKILQQYNAKIQVDKSVVKNGVTYIACSQSSLTQLMQQAQAAFPSSAIRLGPRETLRRCMYTANVQTTTWRGFTLRHGSKRLGLRSITEAQFPVSMWPVQLGEQWVFPRQDAPVFIEGEELKGEFVDCSTDTHWTGSIDNWVARINVSETICLQPTVTPCLCLFFLRQDEEIALEDAPLRNQGSVTQETSTQRTGGSQRESSTSNVEKSAIRTFPGSQFAVIELRRSGPTRIKSQHKQTIALKGFKEIVDLVSEVQQNGYDIKWDHDRLNQRVLELTGPYLKQLPHSHLREVILDLDFEESQDIRNTAIKHYLEENKMVPPIAELRDLLKQRAITAQSIFVTQTQINKTKEDSTRLLEQIKALGSNKILLKTSRVLDSFSRDLRECEVKIQILEQRLVGLQAKLQVLDTDIVTAEDAVKVIF